MDAKKQNIFFWLAKLPLLILYISFFTVQLFFNFDITGRPVNKTASSFYQPGNDKTQLSTVKKSGLPTDSKTSFRLNKRYQPKETVTCATVVIMPLVCIISSKLHVHYSSGFTLPSILSAHFFRGPPIVV